MIGVLFGSPHFICSVCFITGLNLWKLSGVALADYYNVENYHNHGALGGLRHMHGRLGGSFTVCVLIQYEMLCV